MSANPGTATVDVRPDLDICSFHARLGAISAGPPVLLADRPRRRHRAGTPDLPQRSPAGSRPGPGGQPSLREMHRIQPSHLAMPRVRRVLDLARLHRQAGLARVGPAEGKSGRHLSCAAPTAGAQESRPSRGLTMINWRRANVAEWQRANDPRQTTSPPGRDQSDRTRPTAT